MEKVNKFSQPASFWRNTDAVLRNGRFTGKTLTQAIAPTRLQIALWVVLMAAALVLFIFKYSEFQIGAHFQDDATYIVLAESLAHSDTYGLIHSPGEILPTHYPVGYPLLLAPFVLLFPGNLDALRFISLAATLVNIALLFWGWRYFGRHRSYWWGLTITAFYALSPVMVDFSRMVMSEPVFLTCCLCAFILAEQAGDGRMMRGWAVWMALALLFAVLLRTVGVALVVCVFGYIVWKQGLRAWKPLLWVAGGMALLAALIVLLTPVAPGDLLPTTYVSQVAQTASDDVSLLQTINPFEKITWYAGSLLRQLLIPIGGGEIEKNFLGALGFTEQPFLVGLFLVGMMTLGWIVWVRYDGVSAFNLFPFIYLGLVYFWDWEGIRFLYPIASQLQFAFLIAIEAVLLWLAKRLPLPGMRAAPRVLFALVIAAFLLGSVYKSVRLEASTVHVGDMYARTAWLKANTQLGDIVLTEEPIVDYVNSARKTVAYRDEYSSAAELAGDLQNENVKYVLSAPGLWWQPSYVPQYSDHADRIRPLLDALVAGQQLVPVYNDAENLITVFRVQR